MRRILLALTLLAVIRATGVKADTPRLHEILSDESEIGYGCMPAIAGAANLAAPKIRFVFIRFPPIETTGDGAS
jgi:hypothetical protein